MTTNSSASTGSAMGLTCCMGPDWPYTPWGAPLDKNIDVDWKEVQRFFHSLPKMHQLIVVHATYLTGPHIAVGTAYSMETPAQQVRLGITVRPQGLSRRRIDRLATSAENHGH